ncbi:fimbrial protein [Serratia fonticola]|uniref:fimbrial protein n=1 Tax=Serratia fonticola TaxID=47917 RepID=UPI000F975251|nr:fimbrial protein [Serratia fonticola]NTY88437.1 type 1 fimbrial protein [Serratia fonticola]NTZ15002.1 type 1 fimbrial protein [Serratia fonticola]CAI1665586.1 Type-1A pilin [Serratia fonticola]
MKKLTIVASLIAVFGSVGMAQAASTGTITFEGELTANTCDVVVDGQNADATVILPTVSTSQLQDAANTAGDTSFVMALSNCSGTLETASAFFQAGASVDAVTGRLMNMGAGATNVSLQLLDGSSPTQEVIKVGSPEQVGAMTYKTVTGGSTTLPYIVRYYAEAPTTAGTVVSNVVYSIQYQ